VFDTSRLEPAALEFVVVSDTHHILDPEMYAHEGDSVSAALTRDWSARAEAALGLATALETPLLFHVGDLTQEYPGHPRYDAGQRSSRERLVALGLQAHYVAGNMDIGDKPDPTSPAGWVEPEFLDAHETFYGRSYYSLSRGGVHFVALNSQIMNSALEAGERQRAWLEEDLTRHHGERVVVLLHIPPFVVDEDEPGLGAYDTLSEPARGWLLGLFRRHDVEAVFSGHIHFRTFNRLAGTRLHTVPSTTLTRPGFCDVFPIVPEDGGWADRPKLGFFLVRVLPDRIDVHLVRTNGARDAATARRTVTRLSRGLPDSPLGAYLRQPLATWAAGAVVYPNLVRHRVRDDYPLTSAVELGLRHVRFPIGDLADAGQRERLRMLRDEGVSLTATVVRGPGAADPAPADVADVDCVELQLAGRLEPDDADATLAASLRRAGVTVVLAPIVMERGSTVHGRARVGYRPDELAGRDGAADRALVLLGERPWPAVLALAAAPRGALDLILPLGADRERNAALVAEGILAAATLPHCRLFIDALQDVDRNAALVGGLLDRLSNPRPAFHVARELNTVLFASAVPGAYTPSSQPVEGAFGVRDGDAQHWLVTSDAPADAFRAVASQLGSQGQVTVFDLVAGESRQLDAAAVDTLTPDRPATLVSRG
jgi:hypothetical protein